MSKSQCKYYSQYGEDYLLWQLFKRKASGFFVDVGAFDGVHYSNSYCFEQQGWSGICIEAHPRSYELCRRARPGSMCLHGACVQDDQHTTVEFNAEALGLFSGIAVDRDEVQWMYDVRRAPFEGFEAVSVPAMVLDDVFAQHLPADTDVDFLSVDVEGTEIEVLKGLDLNRFRPRIIIVEVKTDQGRAALDQYLVRQHGYHESRLVRVNQFYTRDPADARCLHRIRGWCRREHTTNPLGEQYTFQEPQVIDFGGPWERGLRRVLRGLGRVKRRLSRRG